MSMEINDMKHSAEELPSISIERIVFNDENGFDVHLNNDDIVILVGTNNVGKSRVLKDIRDDIVSESKEKILVKDLDYTHKNFNADTLSKYFSINVRKDYSGNYLIPMGDGSFDIFDKNSFGYITENERRFYKAMFNYLSTENRLIISKPIRSSSEYDQSAYNIICKLQDSKDAIVKLNHYLGGEFGLGIEVYIDDTENTVTRSYKVVNVKDVETIIKADRRESHTQLINEKNLQDQGDGIRNTMAVLASLIVGEQSLLLIDEPESFLHPPQAKSLGRDIVNLSSGKQCFISTHSIDFIKGVLEVDPSRVKIIKIDRDGDNNSFHVIDNEDIIGISNNKSLKHTNILDGLFYKQIALCENESDCKFYSTILEHTNPKKYQETLFFATGGKHQFKIIVPLLNKLNVKYSIIADIDLIDSEKELSKVLNEVSPNSYSNIENDYKRFKELFEKESNSQVKTKDQIENDIKIILKNEEKYISKKAVDDIKQLIKDVTAMGNLKEFGISALPSGECITLFDTIRSYLTQNSIYILKCGEIEKLVPSVQNHGIRWVDEVFTKYPNLDDKVYNAAKEFIKEVFG